jgi:hypothetical protein
VNRRFLVVSSIAAAGILAACDEKTSDLSDTVRPNAYGFQMVSQATNLPRGSARFRLPSGTVPESIVVSVRGLDSLGAGFWTAWIGDSLGTSFVRATGTLSVLRQDTTLNPLGQVDTTQTTVPIGAVSALPNGGPNQAWTWVFTRATSGVTAADSMQTFLITMEDVANATVPGTRRVVWARRIEAGTGTTAGSTKTAGLKFGNYGSTPVTEYLYSGSPARGRGYFQRQVVSVNDSTLARPPLGYYYAVWLVGPFYTTSDTLFAGDLRSPWPRRELSLFNADSIITDPEVVLDVPRQITAGALRISGDTIGLPAQFPYQGYAFVRLTIEPKAGIRGRMGVNRILQAPVPFLILTGGLQ